MPFALRWVHAELPERLGRAGETVERLHALLELCRVEAEAAAAQDVPEAGGLLTMPHEYKKACGSQLAT